LFKCLDDFCEKGPDVMARFNGESFEYNPEMEALQSQHFEWGSEAEWGGVAISPRMRAEVEKHKAAHDAFMRAAALMRKHVSVKNGGLHFTLPARSTNEAAAKLGMDHRLFCHLYKSLKARNARLKRGELVTARSGQSHAMISREEEAESSPSRAGVTKFETVWWGLRLWLDECQTQALVDTSKVARRLCRQLVSPGVWVGQRGPCYVGRSPRLLGRRALRSMRSINPEEAKEWFCPGLGLTSFLLL
jgi:hypothetical protein